MAADSSQYAVALESNISGNGPTCPLSEMQLLSGIENALLRLARVVVKWVQQTAGGAAKAAEIPR